MKKVYLATSRFSMTFADDFWVEKGDVVVYDPAYKSNLAVYRNGSIAKVANATPGGVQAIVNAGWLKLPPAPAAAIKIGEALASRVKQHEESLHSSEETNVAAEAVVVAGTAEPSPEATVIEISAPATDEIENDDAPYTGPDQADDSMFACVRAVVAQAQPLEEEHDDDPDGEDKPNVPPVIEPDFEKMPYTDLLQYARMNYGISLAASAGRKKVIASIRKKQAEKTGAPLESVETEESSNE